MSSSPPAPSLETSSNPSEPAGHGRDARTPGAIPWRGLKDVGYRVVTRVMTERVTLMAAGVTFYLLLSLFPGLAALVSLYGLIADPNAIAGQAEFLSALFPADAMNMILGQLRALATANDSSLSTGFLIGVLIALWSAHNGVVALFDAMNLAYEEREERSFFRITLLTIAFTLGGMLVASVLLAALAVLPVVMAVVFIPARVELLMTLVRWPIMLGFIWLSCVLIYRHGPSRRDAKLRWLNWGTGFSTLLWLISSVAFSYYLERFANLNATYGTLGTFIGFMLWTWVSTVILIVGAILNAELEHQTETDSTIGPNRPMGERGAHVADTLGAVH